ncbi:dipeptidase [Hyphomonas oceanitis]|uniref:Membrane dipeptidase n=1 Tax=Hyphomonas oceanitis SCH89 TaxID=1280953 RepID=A0A059G632_9PROT|nr:dipeptidase [Hyphomonas oceanitis]KDA02045.1 membrane dipeptidase [Hyphomonas oceanitis SCH89]
MKIAITSVLALALVACSQQKAPAPAEPEAVAAPKTAAEIHDEMLVLDTHLDTPANFSKADFDIMADNPSVLGSVQVDLPKMNRGGLDGGFWVTFTPQGPMDPASYEAAKQAALTRNQEIHDMVAAHPESFELAYTSEDAARIAATGKKVVYMSIENSYPLGTDIGMVEEFYNRGVRMIGPVHFRDNQFADSATDLGANDYGGLSPLGVELIKEANRLGMMVDGSHASDSTVDDIIELSTTPIMLSHTGVKAVYDHPRNIDDDLMRKVADDGGVIQINAYGGYLEQLTPTPERQAALDEMQKEFEGISPATADAETRDRYIAKMEEIDAQFPAPRSTFEKFLEHMNHALEVVGPDHVGMGADWDGGGGVVGMEDVSFLPRVTEALLAEGYSEEDIQKIWSGNMLKLMKQVEDAAAPKPE